MTDMFFLIAGGLSAAWVLVHCLVGGKQIAQPLIAAQALAPVVRHTQYLCWHFTSVAIAAMAGFFIWAAYSGTVAFATAGTILALGFASVGVGLVVHMGENHLRLPQGWMFLPVAVLGVLGHVS